MGHTEGKWIVWKSEEGIFTVVTYNFDEVIAITIKDNKSSKAYANRIVQMHNSFDGLLNACKDALEIIVNPAEIGEWRREDTKLCKKQLKSAIAEAERK